MTRLGFRPPTAAAPTIKFSSALCSDPRILSDGHQATIRRCAPDRRTHARFAASPPLCGSKRGDVKRKYSGILALCAAHARASIVLPAPATSEWPSVPVRSSRRRRLSTTCLQGQGSEPFHRAGDCPALGRFSLVRFDRRQPTGGERGADKKCLPSSIERRRQPQRRGGGAAPKRRPAARREKLSQPALTRAKSSARRR